MIKPTKNIYQNASVSFSRGWQRQGVVRFRKSTKPESDLRLRGGASIKYLFRTEFEGGLSMNVCILIYLEIFSET